jgi:purine-nucleoside phosphorylase
MDNIYEKAVESVKTIQSKVPESLAKPKVAIICGTGLGGLANVLWTIQRS